MSRSWWPREREPSDPALPKHGRSKMPPVSKARIEQNKTRRAAERALGMNAQHEGVCARCGRFTVVNGHERLARSQGGDPSKPDCLLCHRCNTWCEDDPIMAAWWGWKLSRKYPAAPSLAPDEAVTLARTIHRFPAPIGASA